MPARSLEVLLNERLVGEIVNLGGERSIFVFDEAYAEDPGRPILSLSFKSEQGGLLLDQPATRKRLFPFFSNLLPEGPLRGYLAERAGVNPEREFQLLEALGEDLPGAVTVRAMGRGEEDGTDESRSAETDDGVSPLRFSLAGVQIKFSAFEKARGGLTIPATGEGGDWIVKLPSPVFPGVPENEFSMMQLARRIGIETPEVRLVSLSDIQNLPSPFERVEGQALAVRRFDRGAGGRRIHMEDFAQILRVYPEKKYQKATYRLLARIAAMEAGEAGAQEFVRRLVLSALIGNADMHLKNWTLLYRDGVTPSLSPAYDLVATQAYVPDSGAALGFASTKRWDRFDFEELALLAAGAGLPKATTFATAKRTVEAFRETWPHARNDLPIDDPVAAVIDGQLEIVPLAARPLSS